MRIFSYNVNGIRAAISKGLLQWLETNSPDVVCLQEIKATQDQIPLMESETRIYELFRKIEMPLVPIVAEMELCGAVADVEYCRKLKEKYEN